MNDDQAIKHIQILLEQGTRSLTITGLGGSARVYTLARIFQQLTRPALVLVPGLREAERCFHELAFFMGVDPEEAGCGGHRLRLFPPYDLTPLCGLSPDRDRVAQRLAALYGLMAEDRAVVICAVEAASLRLMPKEALSHACDLVMAGEEVDRGALVRKLEQNGYQRTSLVEERGDYSVRGGVIDLFPPLHPRPVRLEFWGDMLESIREFDPLSQRSRGRLEDLVILPAGEIVLNEATIQRARSTGRLPWPGGEPGPFPGQEAWLRHFYAQQDTLFDYLPSRGLLCLIEPQRMRAAVDRSVERFARDGERFRQEAADKGRPFPEIAGLELPFEEMEGRLAPFARIRFSELPLDSGAPGVENFHFQGRFHLQETLEVRIADKGRVSLAPLAQRISAWLQSRGRVVVVVRTPQQAERLTKILGNYGLQAGAVQPDWRAVPLGPGLWLCLGRLSQGFVWEDCGLYVISEDEIFGSKRARRRSAREVRERALTWSSFSQLQAGDPVVHEDHGIGRYQGLVKMEIQAKINDFVIIEYAQGDRLYIPADRISVLQKYVGAEEHHVKLDRLGGRSWNVAKEKARKSVKRIAKHLIELYALRKYRQGYPYSQPDHVYREFEATFEHEETSDQVKAIEDVLSDMTSSRPMDRLICGDVGFGKTEVALRAAFKAVEDGKQVAVLVPTTVLAEQHYQTFRARMAPYGIRVGLLSRFKSRREQTEVLARLRSGKLDILIGTHRLLQRDVTFRELGLVIVDEEQRFGVKQKEALKRMRALVDVLAITATPIPRTFQMSLMGVRDLSVIETPPEDRQAIETYLSPYDEALIARAIRFELARGGQVFFVHNRVHNLEHYYDRLARIVPEARLGIAHGQMKEKELESSMLRFLHREIDVLACSSIIESGLDIPSANTIIINQVDRLGLAQIYQLRGRVGRSREKAYAYLLVSQGVTLSRDAEKRLKALMDFSHLGAGIHLAMHDLKIRGGGNILGFAQSGHISAVGYELYMKLIEQAVTELKGEEWVGDINPEINVPVPAFLPSEYVLDTDVRLNLYRRLSTLRDGEDLESMREEIRDRFGPMPREVENLMAVMAIRLRLKRLRALRLDMNRNAFIVTFSENAAVDPAEIVHLARQHSGAFRMLAPQRLRIQLPARAQGRELPAVAEALDRLRRACHTPGRSV